MRRKHRWSCRSDTTQTHFWKLNDGTDTNVLHIHTQTPEFALLLFFSFYLVALTLTLTLYTDFILSSVPTPSLFPQVTWHTSPSSSESILMSLLLWFCFRICLEGEHYISIFFSSLLLWWSDRGNEHSQSTFTHFPFEMMSPSHFLFFCLWLPGGCRPLCDETLLLIWWEQRRLWWDVKVQEVKEKKKKKSVSVF